MSWNRDSNPCCRYAKCPRTRLVPGVGLRTDVEEVENAFCRECHERLYAHAPYHDPKVRVGRGWSPRFRHCVDPDCAHTSGGETAEAHAALGFCEACYAARARPKRRCARCGEDAPAARRASFPYGAVCDDCNTWANATACARCGKTDRVGLRDETGAPVCMRCAAPVEPCADCGLERIVNRRTEDGIAVCATCSLRRSKHDRCSTCGTTGVYLRSGRCGACHRKDRAPEICTECGRPTTLVRKGLCAACYTYKQRSERGLARGHRRISVAGQVKDRSMVDGNDH